MVGGHEVKISLVVLLILNWNTFPYVCRLVGIIQLDWSNLMYGKERSVLEPLWAKREMEIYLESVGVDLTWKGSSTVIRERKSMWPQTDGQVGKLVDINGEVPSECLVYSLKLHKNLREDSGVCGLRCKERNETV